MAHSNQQSRAIKLRPNL